MKKLKVMTVVGTRPEIIRLSRVMAKIDGCMDQVIVHTGQNYDYELNQVFFKDMELRKPDYFLQAACNSMCETVGLVIARVDEVIKKERPDALLILGDTNSCLAAYPAKRRKIPVFHMEAGNRCFDQRVPEEINRKIIDHISDINMPYSTIAREYLLREGLPPDRVIKTGSPMYEVLHYYMDKIKASKIHEQLDLKPQKYYAVSTHREENVDSNEQFSELVETLTKLAETGLPLIFTTHPRTRKRFEVEKVRLPESVKLHKPFGFFDYVHLQMHARAVLSDSGTINEESSILNFPALNLRQSYERPEGMEEGAVMLVGMHWERVRQGLALLETQARGNDRMLKLVADYNVPNISDKVVRIILSYTDYINHVVWRKAI
jgi:UDP-N-acetylglucosamine 2-epimerase (non-hydrolysing)